MPATSAGMTRLVSYVCNCMKERAGDMPSPASGIVERFSLRVGELKKSLIGTPRNERRIMEFMPAYGAAGSPEGTVGEKLCFPIAEVQLARREAGRMPQQAGHGMAHPLRVLESFTEHHVAAAFAMHRAGLAKSPETALETMGVCQPARVKLRIAAGEPAGVAVIGGWLIRQRRERNDLGAAAPPAVTKMRIHERKCRIHRDRDALSGRRQSGAVARCGNRERRCAGDDSVKIEMALRHIGKAIEPHRKIRVRFRLYKAQMTF